MHGMKNSRATQPYRRGARHPSEAQAAVAAVNQIRAALAAVGITA